MSFGLMNFRIMNKYGSYMLYFKTETLLTVEMVMPGPQLIHKFVPVRRDSHK